MTPRALSLAKGPSLRRAGTLMPIGCISDSVMGECVMGFLGGWREKLDRASQRKVGAVE